MILPHEVVVGEVKVLRGVSKSVLQVREHVVRSCRSTVDSAGIPHSTGW